MVGSKAVSVIPIPIIAAVSIRIGISLLHLLSRHTNRSIKPSPVTVVLPMTICDLPDRAVVYQRVGKGQTASRSAKDRESPMKIQIGQINGIRATSHRAEGRKTGVSLGGS